MDIQTGQTLTGFTITNRQHRTGNTGQGDRMIQEQDDRTGRTGQEEQDRKNRKRAPTRQTGEKSDGFPVTL